MEAKVLIVTGSESDLVKLEPCEKILEQFSITFEVAVASAHRTPRRLEALIREAEESGVEVIIAAAGMSAHLPGVVASKTGLPVIGLPLDGGLPGGIDALFSIVQMPPGVPVATVGVNGAKNAGLLAARILALKYPEIRETLAGYRESLERGERP